MLRFKARLLCGVLLGFFVHHSLGFIKPPVVSSRPHFFRNAVHDDIISAGGALKDAGLALDNNFVVDGGFAFCRAGKEWERGSWEGVTVAFEESSTCFEASSVITAAYPGLSTSFEIAAMELKEASDITACISVGPQASVPNLLALADALSSAVESLSGLKDKSPSTNSAADQLNKASQDIRRAISSVESQ